MKQLPLDDFIESRRLAYSQFDDFFHYTTAEDFTSVISDLGTIATEDAQGGILVLTASDGTVADNDEVYLKGTVEAYKFANDQPIVFDARLKFTEANTDDANVIVGMMNAVAANSLLDDGAGPPNNSNHAVFFKVDGSTKWNFETSIGTTQRTTEIADVTNAGNGAYRRFEIYINPVSSTYVEFIPRIDGVQCRDSNGNAIKHRMDYSSGTTEMQLLCGVKNGGANNEIVRLDYIAARQLRA